MSLLLLNTLLGIDDFSKPEKIFFRKFLFYKMDLIVMAQADCSGSDTGYTTNSVSILSIFLRLLISKNSPPVVKTENLPFTPVWTLWDNSRERNTGLRILDCDWVLLLSGEHKELEPYTFATLSVQPFSPLASPPNPQIWHWCGLGIWDKTDSLCFNSLCYGTEQHFWSL